LIAVAFKARRKAGFFYGATKTRYCAMPLGLDAQLALRLLVYGRYKLITIQ
jgi:hypothetical protein